MAYLLGTKKVRIVVRKTDWREIEKKWKAGATNVSIAAELGVTEGYVRKVAKKKQWVRGAAMDKPPRKKYVRTVKAKPVAVVAPVIEIIPEPAIVEPDPVAVILELAAAPDVPAVVAEQLPAIPKPAKEKPAPSGLTGLSRCADLAERMLDELDVVTSRIGEIEELIEIETGGDAGPQRQKAMLRAISIDQRAKTLEVLIKTLKESTGMSADKGKKEQLADKAEEVSSGKFSQRPSPGKLRAV